jgi:hypothetical protein
VTKQLVLEIFAQNNNFIIPDQIWSALNRRLDRRSVYSYLLRLKRQGLLETHPFRHCHGVFPKSILFVELAYAEIPEVAISPPGNPKQPGLQTIGRSVLWREIDV